MQPASATSFDTLIIGAGLSGIGVAARLTADQPQHSFAILEARERLGGTWDLFRYPGVRSDSDLFTYAYAEHPWERDRVLASGEEILDYLREVADRLAITERIRFGQRATSAEWNSDLQRWSVCVVDSAGETTNYSCRFLFCATGYYRYDVGFSPRFEGAEKFGGKIIHPQHWPENFDYSGKRVVVIGSGATAVTLVPAMAATAEHVTMLQRSPSYIMSVPSVDKFAGLLRKLVGPRIAHAVTRRKNILLQVGTYRGSRRFPAVARRIIELLQRRHLPRDFAIDPHFTPKYRPWDQRLCMVPDGDLFSVLSTGKASIVTDTIDRFTEDGIIVGSGETIPADVVITATGLNLLALGGLEISVDGQAVELGNTLVYKGSMLGGVPNFLFAVGYTNSSWTLKVDLIAEYFARLLEYMKAEGYSVVTPTPNDGDSADVRPLLDFAAGYVQRSVDQFPVQGAEAPWKLSSTYNDDIRLLRKGRIADTVAQFTR